MKSNNYDNQLRDNQMKGYTHFKSQEGDGFRSENSCNICSSLRYFQLSCVVWYYSLQIQGNPGVSKKHKHGLSMHECMKSHE